jgi:hypothetical protein
MRPRYETEEDRNGETAVVASLCRRWDCSANKLSDRYELDYLLLREGRGKAWLEIKIRTNKRDAYRDYMISFGKVLAARRLSQGSGLPSFLLVKWTDCVGYMRLNDIKRFYVSIGGRTDREDFQDIEPVVYIPTQDFVRLRE